MASTNRHLWTRGGSLRGTCPRKFWHAASGASENREGSRMVTIPIALSTPGVLGGDVGTLIERGGVMKLRSAHIHEYKSIWDSNLFNVDRVTCLVGKNEAGKTAV